MNNFKVIIGNVSEYLCGAICGNVGGTFVGSGDLRRNGDGFGL